MGTRDRRVWAFWRRPGVELTRSLQTACSHANPTNMRRNEVFLSAVILSFYILQLNPIISENMEEYRSQASVFFRSSDLKHSYDTGVPQVATVGESHALPSSANPCILSRPLQGSRGHRLSRKGASEADWALPQSASRLVRPKQFSTDDQLVLPKVN